MNNYLKKEKSEVNNEKIIKNLFDDKWKIFIYYILILINLIELEK